MAVIQYTGIVNQVRGKLNGSVFNKSRNANTLQRKQQAPRRQVGQSSRPRNRFSEIQRTWKTISSLQRTQWATAAANNPSRDRFGNLVALSGYNQFIKANLFAAAAGIPQVITPDSNPAPDPLINVSDFYQVDFSIAPSGVPNLDFGVAVDSAYVGANMYIIADIGLPVSAGVTVYYSRYAFVVAGAMVGFTDLDSDMNLSIRYPFPQEGQRVFTRVRVVYVANGAVVYESVFSQFPSIA